MWQRALKSSEVDRFGVRGAIWATGNNASEMRLGRVGTCGLEDEARSTDHLFLRGPAIACPMSTVRLTGFVFFKSENEVRHKHAEKPGT